MQGGPGYEEADESLHSRLLDLSRRPSTEASRSTDFAAWPKQVSMSRMPTAYS